MFIARPILAFLSTYCFAISLFGAPPERNLAEETRSSFLQLIDRPKVPLAPQVREMPALGNFKRIHFIVASDAKQNVTGYIVYPERYTPGERRAVLIVLHGTGGNKDSKDVQTTVSLAARAGFIGVAIDGRYHGERTQAGVGTAEYNAAISRAWQGSGEHPFYYDTVWDVMRVIDYLQMRADVDSTRVGVIGFSKGGVETYLAAAADPRIRAAVPCIGVQSFHWELDNGQWRARIATIQSGFDAAAKLAGESDPGVAFVRKFYERVAPGIDGMFDGPAMLPLIAPRALLVINSDSDANTPIAGVRLAVAAARASYRAQNAEDKLALRIQENTAHHVNPESLDAAIAWFVRWLQPEIYTQR